MVVKFCLSLWPKDQECRCPGIFKKIGGDASTTNSENLNLDMMKDIIMIKVILGITYEYLPT